LFFFKEVFVFNQQKELKKMIIDNIDPKTVRGSVGLMLREERGKGYYFVFFKRLLALYNKQVNIELVDRK